MDDVLAQVTGEVDENFDRNQHGHEGAEGFKTYLHWPRPRTASGQFHADTRLLARSLALGAAAWMPGEGAQGIGIKAAITRWTWQHSAASRTEAITSPFIVGEQRHASAGIRPLLGRQAFDGNGWAMALIPESAPEGEPRAAQFQLGMQHHFTTLRVAIRLATTLVPINTATMANDAATGT